jgi:hypothetical protein
MFIAGVFLVNLHIPRAQTIDPDVGLAQHFRRQIE